MVPILKAAGPVALMSLLLLPLAARADVRPGSVELSPFAGYDFFQDRQNLEHSPVFGGRIGYNITERFGVEGTGQFTRSRVDDRSQSFTREGQFTSPADDVDISRYHLDLLYHFMPKEKLNPFITAGYGVAHYSPSINHKGVMSAVDFGVGAKYWLAENVALRVDVRDSLVFDDQIHTIESTAGVVFRFGGAATPARAQTAQAAQPDQAVQPAPVVAPLDSDRDGVNDSEDRCPNTPAGVAVDAKGCPVDSDRDGVPDYLDRCPGTPTGAAVDANGCPPVAAKAAVVAAVAPQVIVLSFEDIHFDFDQSTLKPEAKVILKRNIQVLNDNPKASIRIAGYTSAAGSEAYNQKLSERRAASVRAYLVSEGLIEPARLSIIGYGETHPAAFEATPGNLDSPAAKANIRVLFEITVN
jgi:OOP family OmpA-OmpF porin